MVVMIPPRQAISRGLRSLIIAVLSLNLWTTLLVIPLHEQQSQVGHLTLALALLPIVPLILGTLFQSGLLLLGFFPVSLLLPVVSRPSLVGTNMFAGWSLFLVAGDLVLFVLGTSFLLAQAFPAHLPRRGRDLGDSTHDRPPWPQRRLLHLALTVLSGLLPLSLFYALYLRPNAFSDLRHNYPGRSREAATLLGILALCLWIYLFARHFARPLGEHMRGITPLAKTLDRLRIETQKPRPRARFYVTVVLALAFMAAFVIFRG
ncbi:MAG: hypothetical protein KAI47_07555 [Deltaproteobacteria bacterium]|nr:hypothetical protein [Deltaproteobacteria bacterium]